MRRPQAYSSQLCRCVRLAKSRQLRKHAKRLLKGNAGKRWREQSVYGRCPHEKGGQWYVDFSVRNGGGECPIDDQEKLFLRMLSLYIEELILIAFSCRGIQRAIVTPQLLQPSVHGLLDQCSDGCAPYRQCLARLRWAVAWDRHRRHPPSSSGEGHVRRPRTSRGGCVNPLRTAYCGRPPVSRFSRRSRCPA